MANANLKKKNNESNNLHFAVLATDIALFTLHEGKLWLRMISIDLPPHFINKSGLPGGLIHPAETAEQAVARLMTSKAEVSPTKTYVEQLYTFSEIKRDPRGRVVAVAYLGLVPWEKLSASERLEKNKARWVDVETIRDLAYDHKDIIEMARARLRSKITYTTLISQVMPKEFSLSDLELAYSILLGKNLDKRNFRKKILGLNILKQLSKERRGGKFRPAKLYSFASKTISEISLL